MERSAQAGWLGGVARDRAFLGASALLFAASAAGTAAWCGSMSGGMPMPGGWTMSMAWMRMPGQGWLGAAASFMEMWVCSGPMAVLLVAGVMDLGAMALVAAAITLERLAPWPGAAARATGVAAVAAGALVVARALGAP